MSTNLRNPKEGYLEDPGVKYFVARKACTIAFSEAQGTDWNVIKCKECLGIV
jgi:hypothetical protein